MVAYFYAGLDDLECRLNSYGNDGINELFNYLTTHPLNQLSSLIRSDLFVCVFQTRYKMCERRDITTVAHIWEVVLWPTVKQCETLLETIAASTIKLADCDKYFEHFESRERLKERLLIFTECITKCSLTRCLEIFEPAIDYTLKLIRIYWVLCRYRDYIDIFHKLQDIMDLHSDDFIEMEKFLSIEVCY